MWGSEPPHPPDYPAHSPNNLKRIKTTETGAKRPKIGVLSSQRRDGSRIREHRWRTSTVEKKKWHQPLLWSEGRQHSTVSMQTIGLGETGMTVMAGVAGRCCEKLSASYFAYFESAAIVL